MAEIKKGDKVLDIKEVPTSPNTSNSPARLYNPLNEDYEFKCEAISFTVPAKGFLNEAEYRVFHGAKHLAEMIIMQKWQAKIKEDIEAKKITPWIATAPPRIEIQKMMEALVTGPEAFDGDVVRGSETPPAPEKEVKPVEVPKEESKEEPKEEDGKPDFDNMKWGELQSAAREKGKYKVGMKKAEVISALKSQ